MKIVEYLYISHQPPTKVYGGGGRKKQFYTIQYLTLRIEFIIYNISYD